MPHSRNPSVWTEKRRTSSGDFKYRVRAEADGRRLPAGPWTPKKTWAEEEKSKLSARLWAGDRDVATERRRMTWETFSPIYLKYSETAKGRRTYEQFDKPAIESFGSRAKGRLLASLDTQDATDWLIALKVEGYNATSCKMMYEALNTSLNWAVKTKLLAANPLKGLPKPHSDESGRALTNPELSKLLEHGTETLRGPAVFSLNTGVRISEVVMLHKSMVKDGFGQIPARLRKTRRKVSKDLRFPINAAARDAMGVPKEGGLYFPQKISGIQHALVRARVAAGLPSDIKFHCFRHTFATRYLARGGHIEDLLETRLWSSYQALLRYVHVKDQTLKKRFNALRFPPLSPQKAGRTEAG